MTEPTSEPMPPVPRGDAGPTERDEETVLEGLYGPADQDGIYSGEAGR